MTSLEGRRVLLLEDESLVAMLGEDMLLELGCEVEVVMRLDQALALARTVDFDLAILDVNLGKHCSYPVADVLFERCIPFMFATGYGTAGIEPAYAGVPVMQKPYQIGQMAALLRHLLTCEPASRTAQDTVETGSCACTVGRGRASFGLAPAPARIRAD